ncbi:YisL family protein [Pontibacillus litoralis]|uniref:UPF0344 protein N784_14325 n=1 Tax=Pontibacillus litoralis JSM 072002 TaxID=1385512 RepID=A0A0A5G6U9_9BACI|nr:YisL family protein [Pontibacillus litoralis]KGX87779.1 hypothetical protein N784_14325 [Pontibacillus litoralis JSM 072002]
MTHLHITSWVLALILLALALWFYRSGKEKPGKISHMILRLNYFLILYSGGDLFAQYMGNASGAVLGEVIVKAIAGVWIIFAMEMVLVRTSKDKPTKSAWIQLIIMLLIAIILGFGRLPMGLA